MKLTQLAKRTIAIAGINLLTLLSGCAPATSDIAALILEDSTESFLKDTASVELSQKLCAELVRKLPYDSKVSKVEVTSEKAIPGAWQTLTNRRQALGDCHQQKEVVPSSTPGTYACLGGETALEMMHKTPNHRFFILMHIQANEMERHTCPDTWKKIGTAIADGGQMVVVLSPHPLGKRLNYQLYDSLGSQPHAHFCKPEQAIACLDQAIAHLENSHEK